MLRGGTYLGQQVWIVSDDTTVIVGRFAVTDDANATEPTYPDGHRPGENQLALFVLVYPGG
jgi:hypothetical protein